MPIMNGLEALKKIRKLQDKKVLMNFPIIIVSAGSVLTSQDVVDKRIDKCLMKPVSKIALKRVLEEIWRIDLCEK